MLFRNLRVVLAAMARRSFWRELQPILARSRADREASLWRLARASLIILKREKLSLVNGRVFLNMAFPFFPSRPFLTLVESVEDPVQLQRSHALLKKTGPVTICMAITGRCPNACPHCSATTWQKEQDLPRDTWLRIIREVQDINTPVLFFTGGEPLERDDLEDLVSAVDSRSITYLLSSGAGLTLERAHSLKRAGLFGVCISINSADAARDASSRGCQASFDNAVAAVRNAVAAGLFASVVCVVFPESLKRPDDLWRLVELAQNLGAHDVTFKDAVRVGVQTTEPGRFVWTPDDRAALLALQAKMNAHFRTLAVSTEVSVNGTDVFGCVAGLQHTYITPSGQLTPCDFAPLVFGNVVDEGVRAPWMRMRNVIGIPRASCLASAAVEYAERTHGKIVPLQGRDVEVVCAATRPAGLPRFNRVLLGE